jgi:hypothetical protein
MSPAAKGGTQLCSEPQARTRLDHARRFLDVAQLTAGEDDAKEYSSAAAALAVLAGIAASDAALRRDLVGSCPSRPRTTLSNAALDKSAAFVTSRWSTTSTVPELRYELCRAPRAERTRAYGWCSTVRSGHVWHTC